MRLILALLLCMLTLPVAARQDARGRRGGGPPLPRPNMLDDSDVTLRPPWSNSVDLDPKSRMRRAGRFIGSR